MRKVGILTQPLHDNYGGLLQAYALKEVIQSLNHEVIIINRRGKETSKARRFFSKMKKKLFKQKINPRDFLSRNERNIISSKTLAFRKKYISVESEPITDDSTMARLNTRGLTAYVVGSDQCWRPKYSPQITNYFLDFAEEQKAIKRISYAASFGVSNWEYNSQLTKRCSSLAKKFDAISVREDSAVALVEQHLDRKAIHVLDPTMLLEKEHYIKITEEEGVKASSGELKVYILDKTKQKEKIVAEAQNLLGLKEFEVLPKKRFGLDDFRTIQDFVYPGPIQWLKGYRDAKFVITDSFHGTVFSILFNRPFIVIPNISRGIARFESLLKMFGLEDRLISDMEDFDLETMLNSAIDWASVNRILDKERGKAIEFLDNNLR